MDVDARLLLMLIDRIVNETFVARVEHHREIPSTNDRAIQCVGELPGPLPLLITADRQTAGRGRGSNRWWTGDGSLAMTLLIGPDGLGAGQQGRPQQGRSQQGRSQQGRSPLVALAAAVAIVDTVAPLLRDVPVGIHWPNDIWAAGRKMAGILVEVLPSRHHVIGIGLNTNNRLTDAPPELLDKVTTLRELTGKQHDQTTLLVGLLQKMEARFLQLAEEPEQIGRRADRVCLQRGRPLTLRLGDRDVSGVCAGIAPDGALLLDTPNGRQPFYTGVLKT